MIIAKTKYSFLSKAQFIAFFLILLAASPSIYGQAVEMSQYWSAPLHINPALAGISYGPRVSASYRNQWPGLGDGFNGGFVTYMVGVDGYIPKAHSGIGLLYTGDYIAGGLLSSNKITLSYAFQIKLSKKVGMRIGLEGSFIQQHINWAGLQFYDMIDPYTGFLNPQLQPNPTGEAMPDKLSTYHGDAGAGILFFSDKLYGGFAIRNLLMPNESFYNKGDASAPFRMVGHLGSNFNIKHKANYKYNIFVSPNVLVANQGKDVQVNAGIMAGVSLVYFGGWFRYAFKNPDAFILLVGIKKGKFRFGYSYDITVSRLAGRTGGSHELSLVFNWSGSDDNSLHPKANKNYIECPEILKF
ncbi:MAG: hypothetical protein JWO03_4114 [Bacteroidetes bacterium]|nr:hypothetical protein [Bacteroidota bacterium]